MVTFFYKWFALVSMTGFIYSGSVLFKKNEASHPFHVSTTEINHNATDKTLEISCRIFTDDFESAISKEFNQKTDFTKQSMKTIMDTLVKKYLINHLGVSANNRPAVMNYIGRELENEAVYVYFEIETVPVVSQLSMVNTILFNLYDDQINIAHVKVNGNRKSMKLSYPEKTAGFQF